jgi:hypothetical protein
MPFPPPPPSLPPFLAAPTPISTPQYSLAVVAALGSHDTDSNTLATCTPGHFCNGTLLQYPCPTGTFCPVGSSKPVACERGSFCATPASSVKCAPGYFCGERTVQPVPCRNVSEGISCLLPGANELAIVATPGAKHRGLLSDTFLEVIENLIGESVDNGLAGEERSIGYSLRLASPPALNETVVVRITLERSKIKPCIRQPVRVRLLTNDVAFTAGNYNIAQNVTAVVKLDAHFTGSYQGAFQHFIEPGSAWGDVSFLRPVSLTIQDDDSCPPGAAHHTSEASENVQICQCLEGYYVTEKDSGFCSSARACVVCEGGMMCGDDETRSDAFRNQALQDIQIMEGGVNKGCASFIHTCLFLRPFPSPLV